MTPIPQPRDDETTGLRDYDETFDVVNALQRLLNEFRNPQHDKPMCQFSPWSRFYWKLVDGQEAIAAWNRRADRDGEKL